jgi:hypothetical protein
LPLPPKFRDICEHYPKARMPGKTGPALG